MMWGAFVAVLAFIGWCVGLGVVTLEDPARHPECSCRKWAPCAWCLGLMGRDRL